MVFIISNISIIYISYPEIIEKLMLNILLYRIKEVLGGQEVLSSYHCYVPELYFNVVICLHRLDLSNNDCKSIYRDLSVHL